MTPARSGMKEATIRLALVLASLTSTALLIEIGLRIFGSEPQIPYITNLGREQVRDPLPGVRYLYPAYASYSQRWPDNPRGYFDPDNGIRYRVNNYGFRGADFSLARSDALRIAFLGDSFCWGLGVREEDSLAVRVERLLDEQALLEQTFEVYNFCLVGYGTEHEAALYDYVVRHFRPDMLVVWYFLNDVNRKGYHSVRWWNGRRDRRSPSRFVNLLLSPVNRYFANREMLESIEGAYRAGEHGLEGVREGFRRFRRLGSAEGVPSFLAIIPWLYRLDAERYPFLNVHRMVSQLAEQEGFEVLDLLSALEGRRASDLWVHPRDHHLNDVGHAIVARAMHGTISSYLERQGESLVAAAERRRRAPINPALDVAPSREWFRPFVELAGLDVVAEKTTG